MKKRIAIFANGWGDEYLCDIVNGVQSVAYSHNADVFSFINFSILHDDNRNSGEFSIFKLPDIRDFDGVVLLTNSYNMKEEREYLHQEILKYKIPAVSVEYDLDGIISLETDNYNGMYDLVKHMVLMHDSKSVVYVGGPEDHMENQIRLKAVLDVMSEYGLELPKENIMYADWAKNPAKRAMNEWYETHKQLPDVVICANDIMAMAICDWAKEQGLSVPEDFKVTGYDFTYRGQAYSPSIASVSHEWNEMGRKAGLALWKLIEGEECFELEVTKTQFVFAESCGCEVETLPRELQRRRKRRYSRLEDSENDSHFRHIFNAANLCENADELCEKFQELFKAEHHIEGCDFLLCLEQEMFNFKENDVNFLHDNFSDRMEAICF